MSGFQGAFLLLKMGEDERAYTIVTDGSAFYSYAGVPSGRVAAWMGRLGQATSKPNELRSQINVGDPILAAAGPPRTRQRSLARVMLMWMSLGAKLAWQKAQIGHKNGMDRRKL